MEYAIEVNNLSKRFGSLQAVREISFRVARGEVLGFLGPNGAGKSTTMKMITGFLEPSAGRVRVCGFDVQEQPIELKRRIGYLPEGAPAYGEMTPQSFLEFVAEIRAIPRGERAARIRDAVAKIHLESVLHQPIETLSKGFKRRVGLAQAIVHDPQVLILDEPTDGLDPNQKHEVRSLINQMARDKAIVISTHILEEVDALCTRAIIIAGGRLLFDGSPGELEAKSRLHNAVLLGIEGDGAATVREALAALEGVAEVEDLGSDGGCTRLRALPRERRSIVAEVGRLVKDRDWPVTELHVESGRLDEVFRAITTGAAGGPEGRLS